MSNETKVWVINGKVIRWGDSIWNSNGGLLAKTTYSWLELSENQIIKKLSALSGLHSKLKEAMTRGDVVELHIARVMDRNGEENILLAMKAADGRLYKVDWGSSSSASFVLDLGPIILVLGGLFCILTILGAPVGAMAFVHASRLRGLKKRIALMQRYTRSLQGAVAL